MKLEDRHETIKRRRAWLTMLLVGVIAAAPVTAQALRPVLQAATALEIQQAVLRCTADRGYAAAVAVFDDAGRMRAFAAADGASVGAADAAAWKGRSAAHYRYSTRATAGWSVPTAPGIATAAGGLPILSNDGQPLGGVGVSGGPAADDERCAVIGIEQARLKAGAAK